MSTYQITDTEFDQLRKLLYANAGIVLNDSKKILLTGRLGKRLNALGMSNYGQYFKHVSGGQHEDELEFMVDLLTTNETYFFRESKHFDFLRDEVLPVLKPGQPFRVWSAASSIGAEAYTIAMILADSLGESAAWDILGTDISSSVLEKARQAVYSINEAEKIPPQYLKKYCLKGVRSQEGTLLIDRRLRQRVRFEKLNLNADRFVKPGDFDVIFLRNVMIYFDNQTKTRVLENLLPCLKRGGYLIVGHSETLNGITNALPQVKSTIYQKP